MDLFLYDNDSLTLIKFGISETIVEAFDAVLYIYLRPCSI